MLGSWGSVAQARPDSLSAQPASPEQSANFPFVANFQPPGDGRPKKTRGAGARDGLRCNSDGPAMQAIMPEENYGLTFQERPGVWIDFGGTFVPQVLLVFRDELGQTLARNLIPVHAETSVRYFALAETSSPLVMGKNYQWSLLVACDGTINPTHPIFSGWVQRVAATPASTAVLQQQSMIEQINWYARHGYWYDAVATLRNGLEADAADQVLVAMWKDALRWLN